VKEKVTYLLTPGVATLEDVISANAEASEMIKQCKPFVHLTIDANPTEKTALGLGALITVIKSTPSSPNVGWVVHVSKSRLDRFFGSVATQLAKARSRAFDNLEEAIAFLQENDDSLPPIPCHKADR
jgi:hypothetical protein